MSWCNSLMCKMLRITVHFVTPMESERILSSFFREHLRIILLSHFVCVSYGKSRQRLFNFLRKQEKKVILLSTIVSFRQVYADDLM